MVRRSFQYAIVTGKFTFLIVVLLSVSLWIVSYFMQKSSFSPNTYLLWELIDDFCPKGFLNTFISFLLFGLAGYLLIEINNAFSVIRIRTDIHCSLYAALTAIFTFIHPFQVGSIITICLGIAIYFLFRCYQRHEPVGCFFQSMLFIGIGSVLFPQLLYFIPVFFIGLSNFRAFTLRTFFAGLTGLCVPYWFLLGHAFYHSQMELFYAPFQELATFGDSTYSDIGLKEIISGVFLLFVLLVSIIHYAINSYQDKIRTRSYLNFLILILVWMVLFILWQPQYIIPVFAMMLPVSSLIIGHFFALTNTKMSNLFFIFFGFSLIALTIYNIWMP